MLVLFETPAGYALFRVKEDDCLKHEDEFTRRLEDPEGCAELLKLESFMKFENMAEALKGSVKISDGKMPKKLKKFLAREFADEELKSQSLIVSDPRLGSKIAKKLGIKVVSDSLTNELMRGIRAQFTSLVSQLEEKDMKMMAVGLSHSISRHKLKFSPDKVDTMIIQAISLLDDLDKEFNTYVMRLKEWYGWHFPELAKIATDNLAYVRTVLLIGERSNAQTADLSQIHHSDIVDEIKNAARISMGTEVTEDDLDSILFLARQIVDMSEYRINLHMYLRDRIVAIAPNLTRLVGEIVGARLIAHAGSLVNLAKQAASTIQILGSEKALFRALKSKHDTPKYGLIFHASLVGQAAPKIKGRIARALAAKAALSVRYDAFGDSSKLEMGDSSYKKVLSLLSSLEKSSAHRASVSGNAKRAHAKHQLRPAKRYNSDNDLVLN